MYFFLSFLLIFTLVIGRLAEKIKVPFIFAAIFLGFTLALRNPFLPLTSSQTFTFLANLGMYVMLFIVGFEIDFTEIKKKSVFILKTAMSVVLAEALTSSVIIHYFFSCSWSVSLLVGLSFATVGEAILVPILDEFGIINTKLGQTIIGVGTVDDIIEILTLVLVVFYVKGSGTNLVFIIISLIALFFLFFATTKIGGRGNKLKFSQVETLFLFSLFIFFLFLGIGSLADATALAALLAGVSLRTFISNERLKQIEGELKSLAYGFLAPIFFLWVGLSMNISYLIKYPLLILLVVAVSNGTKILASLLVTKSELDKRESILTGIALTVRFSTSIVIVKILFDNAIIDSDLYSVIIASSVVFTIIVPLLFSNLLVKWSLDGVAKNKQSSPP